ncbi:MAG: phosphatase PAP2 family protein [Chloroflexi bacterium]|nr:phosphatase PAP2 family protein [Chloroflexota bacterium]
MPDHTLWSFSMSVGAQQPDRWRQRLAVGVALLALILLASSLVIAGSDVDRSALASMATLRRPLLTQAFTAVTQLGSTVVVGAAALLLTGWLARRRACWPLGPALVTAAAALISEGLKLVVHRPRPEVVEALVTVVSYSYPSGHALVSLTFYSLAAKAVAARLGGRWRPVVWAGALLIILLVGASRVYLGVHYPSDVLAGYAIGLGCLATYSALAPR